MAGKRILKGIVGGLLGTFASRNNDIGGYWGLGVLRLFAEENKLAEVTVDLLHETPNLPAGSPIRASETVYGEWFRKSALKGGFNLAKLEKAEINIRFSTFEEFPNAIRSTRGQPYVCTVTIVRDNGSSYSASKFGICERHNPRKDLRSLRADI